MSDDFDDPIFDMSNAGAQDRGTRQGGNPRETSGPSEKQLAFARTLAGERNEPLPEGIEGDWRICRDFIDRMLKTPRPAGAPGAPQGGGGGGGTRPPSDKQIAFARKLAAERQTEVPETALKDSRACSTFIDEMLAKKPAPGAAPAAPAAGGGGGSAKPPSDKQIAFAQKLSREKNLRLPEGFQQDWRICRDFIDQALGKAQGAAPARPAPSGYDGSPADDPPPAYDGPPDDGPPW